MARLGFRLQGNLTLGTIAGFESIQDLTFERIAVFGNFETSYSGGDIVSGISIRECIVTGFMHFGWESSHCSNSIWEPFPTIILCLSIIHLVTVSL